MKLTNILENQKILNLCLTEFMFKKEQLLYFPENKIVSLLRNHCIRCVCSTIFIKIIFMNIIYKTTKT